MATDKENDPRKTEAIPETHSDLLTMAEASEAPPSLPAEGGSVVAQAPPSYGHSVGVSTSLGKRKSSERSGIVGSSSDLAEESEPKRQRVENGLISNSNSVRSMEFGYASDARTTLCNGTCGSVVSGGPSVANGGPSVVSDGPSLVNGGPSVVSDGPSVVNNGPLLVNGSLVVEDGSTKVMASSESEGYMNSVSRHIAADFDALFSPEVVLEFVENPIYASSTSAHTSAVTTETKPTLARETVVSTTTQVSMTTIPTRSDCVTMATHAAIATPSTTGAADSTSVLEHPLPLHGMAGQNGIGSAGNGSETDPSLIELSGAIPPTELSEEEEIQRAVEESMREQVSQAGGEEGGEKKKEEEEGGWGGGGRGGGGGEEWVSELTGQMRWTLHIYCPVSLPADR